MRYTHNISKKSKVGFLVFIISISILSFISLNLFKNYGSFSYNISNSITQSYFNDDMSPFIIDGNGGSSYSSSYNWTGAAKEEWCTYDSINNIYYIENLTIDAKGYEPCIIIRDSSVNFVIKNCTLFNADDHYYSGTYGALYLYNVHNGKILENFIQSNEINGIYLYNSNDNVIENNTCSDNQENGIYLKNSDDNLIDKNTCSNNRINGIYLYDSTDNVIKNNTCSYNSYYQTPEDYEQNGISLRNGNNNIIGNNTCFTNGLNGIYSSNSDSISIGNNTCMLNELNGIYITAPDGSQGDLFEIENNILIDNQQNGLMVLRCSDIIAINNFLFSNSKDGIYFENSNNLLIKNNTCNSNSGAGINIRSDILNPGNNVSIINNSIRNNNGYGMYLSSTKDFNISCNYIKNNGNWGIILFYCSIKNLDNDTIWDNVIQSNKYGIYLYKSEHVNISENNISDNTAYGVYLTYQSCYNAIINNFLSNNGLYCICYEGNSVNNIFKNNGCDPVNLDLLSGNPGDSGDPLYYLYSIFFLIFFIGIISGLGIFSISKRRNMRRNGIEFDKRGSIVMRDGTNFLEQYESEKVEFTHPVEVKPYEFYCFTCKQKYTGHEVFCPTCGQRMKLYDSYSAFSLTAQQAKNDKNKCMLCFKSKCPTCNAEINGEDPCFEECPYCESVYHKHCWDKTIHTFGKCGFCLEIPPTELIPKDLKK